MRTTRACGLLCALPAAALAGAWWGDALGSNPLEALLHTTGRCALALLVLTLAVTPLRRTLSRLARRLGWARGKRVSDWNRLARLRRPLGVASFAYAGGHCLLYLAFDLGWDWRAWLDDIASRPFLAAGVLAIALMTPLAVTSTDAMMRRLGRWWRRLHALVYPVALLALAHFWMTMKPGHYAPWPETVALALLLGYRASLALGLAEAWAGSDGREVPERAPARPSGVALHCPEQTLSPGALVRPRAAGR